MNNQSLYASSIQLESFIEKIKASTSPHLPLLSFKKHERIFHQETPCFGVYLLIEGIVKVFSVDHHGRETIYNIIKDGEILGVNYIFDLFHHQSAQALEDVKCYFMTTSEFFANLDQESASMKEVLAKLTRDLNLSYAKQAGLIRLNVRERLAEYLKDMAAKFGTPCALGTKINLRLSREEMASILGTASETVIRSLSEFKEMDLITEEEKHLVIRDLSKMDEILGHIKH